jgi:hypothetical protein
MLITRSMASDLRIRQLSPLERGSLGRVEQVGGEAAREQEMPIEPHKLTPEIKNTFWVNLIGRGYPTPRKLFRWCTERMKIDPSNRFIRAVVCENGEAILVLGTRKAESQRRTPRTVARGLWLVASGRGDGETERRGDGEKSGGTQAASWRQPVVQSQAGNVPIIGRVVRHECCTKRCIRPDGRFR